MLKAVAAEIERPAAQVALAWAMARPGICATLIGASTLAQLESNIAGDRHTAQRGTDDPPD